VSKRKNGNVESSVYQAPRTLPLQRLSLGVTLGVICQPDEASFIPGRKSTPGCRLRWSCCVARVSFTKDKTLYLAQVSIREFLRKHKDAYFWTFTEPGDTDGKPRTCWTKDEAERAFKPFRDLCARRGVALLVVWELQKRGAWHPHCLVNKRLDVGAIRDFMVARGWGIQMRVEWVRRLSRNDGTGWHEDSRENERVIRYMTKYLTKSLGAAEGFSRKKCFGGSRSTKCGGISFKWVPWVKPWSYLWACGRSLFFQLYEREPFWNQFRDVVRLGVENVGWADVDPWWEFSAPG